MINWAKFIALELPRPAKRLILIAFDIAAAVAVMWLAFWLRLGHAMVWTPVEVLRLVIAPVIAIPIFVRLGLYRSVVRYLPDRAIMVIAQAVLLTTVIWVALVFLTELYLHTVVPRSVPVIFFFAMTFVVAGSRLAIKWLLGVPEFGAGGRSMLIFGAGSAGVELASALIARNTRRLVGFIDDDPRLQGHDIMGLRVYPTSRLESLVREEGVREVVLPMSTLPQPSREDIYKRLNGLGVRVSTLPAISDLAAGKYAVTTLRQIDIADLLGRSSVPADPELLRASIAGKTVMITGAGGSIGSELSRLIARWRPEKIVLFEANEYALYTVARRLAAESEASLVPVLGSVENMKLVAGILAEHRVQVLFHAAAHKHVPLLETNVLEAVRNNVLGTETVAMQALAAGVESFVLISTDKAVRPSSVMGATKRWAELIVLDCADRALARRTGQRFSVVRFGNVLGSNGSVVPLFREQIAAGGPVTLTDPRMSRYFMSIHEAAELIVQTSSLASGGDIFLLDMGQPILIRDLAENMIRLAGFEPKWSPDAEGDIEIRVIGPRPGEKLSEELFYDERLAERTRQPKILRSTRIARAADVAAALAELKQALVRDDAEAVRGVLFSRTEFWSAPLRLPAPANVLRADSAA